MCKGQRYYWGKNLGEMQREMSLSSSPFKMVSSHSLGDDKKRCSTCVHSNYYCALDLNLWGKICFWFKLTKLDKKSSKQKLGSLTLCGVLVKGPLLLHLTGMHLSCAFWYLKTAFRLPGRWGAPAKLRFSVLSSNFMPSNSATIICFFNFWVLFSPQFL